MRALPAQRDLRQSGKRRTMKRHTQGSKSYPQKKLLKICECEMCGSRPEGRRGLTDHMEIRKNEKRYYCTFCPLRFNTNSSMRRHGRKQHKPESILPVEKLEVPLRFDFGET